MKRLGYIRLLHDQAAVQSYEPAPMSFSSVLGFHDVMEYFFIIAVDHVGGNQNIDLKATFVENAKKLRAPDSNKMSCSDAVLRVGIVRNAFKHNGAIPGTDQIEQSRRDARSYLEANCPRFFGMQFDDISMLHIVSQQGVREHLRLGRTALDDGDLDTAMSEVALAFHRLITGWAKDKFLPRNTFTKNSLELSPDTAGSRRRRFSNVSRPRNDELKAAIDAVVGDAKEAFDELDEEIETLRNAVRIQLAGIDTARYVRFAMLTPEVNVAFGGHIKTLRTMSSEFHTTLENYLFCETFVIDSALRLAGADFRMPLPQTYGDYDRAKTAMAANGGHLPEDWE